MDSTPPAWFLDNCVATVQDLTKRDIPLIMREDIALGDRSNQDKAELDTVGYEIDSAIYEPLKRFISHRNLDMADEPSSSLAPARRFLKDSVHLHFPEMTGGSGFLTTVVERFASDAGADIITLSRDDVNDLAELHGMTCCSLAEFACDIDTLGNADTEDKSREHDLDNHENQRIEGAQFTNSTNISLTSLLSWSGIKLAKSQIQNSTPRKRPLIVYLPNVKDLLDVYKSRFIEALREALKDITSNGFVISTSTDRDLISLFKHKENEWRNAETFPAFMNSNHADSDNDAKKESWMELQKMPITNTELLQEVGLAFRMDVIYMVPVRTQTQRCLFDKHEESDGEQQNIRLLQRAIRQTSVQLHSLSFLQPYADWSFFKGTPAHELFVNGTLNQGAVDEIFQNFSYEPKDPHTAGRDAQDTRVIETKIKQAISTFARRVRALEDWRSTTKYQSKWLNFPSRVSKVIEEIEKRDSFKWERRFLDLLINPNDVEEGWSDIALKPDIKEAIQQLIMQPNNTGMYSYGILKRGRIGGALLYGPPGTGKTHLARVLARESKVITICASAADLVNKYMGQSEKAIQALFNLGQMLFPCTIFLDEANALFRSRKSEDKTWERSQINQFLYEMDGFKTSGSPPFTILATNFPNDLDPAVLRRVPNRIHIGLPSSEARQQIFQMNLADETLHPDISFCRLAEKSQGYSGSDIQTVCIQAALICDTFVGDDARRHLMDAHFDKAFQRCAPTVSKGALAKIRAFAEEYDPAAVDSMERVDGINNLL